MLQWSVGIEDLIDFVGELTEIKTTTMILDPFVVLYAEVVEILSSSVTTRSNISFTPLVSVWS